MRDFWRLGEVTFFLGSSFAIWGLISQIMALQFGGMAVIVLSYPILLAGMMENA